MIKLPELPNMGPDVSSDVKAQSKTLSQTSK